MARHRFGLGEYKYFAYPLPELVTELRESLYSRLSEVANGWAVKLGDKSEYPGSHREFIKLCHAKGQDRPTPLMLRYKSGGYNCLHQDLYGAVYFPLQTVFMLDEPEQDFAGGEFVLVEQRPRAQSAAHVIAPRQGEGVIFTTRWRPGAGNKGALPGQHQTRREHGHARHAAYTGDCVPRCGIAVPILRPDRKMLSARRYRWNSIGVLDESANSAHYTTLRSFHSDCGIYFCDRQFQFESQKHSVLDANSAGKCVEPFRFNGNSVLSRRNFGCTPFAGRSG